MISPAPNRWWFPCRRRPAPPSRDRPDTPRRRAIRWLRSPTDSMCRLMSFEAGTISRAQLWRRATPCMSRNRRVSLPHEAIIAQRPARTRRNLRMARRRRRHHQAHRNRRPPARQRRRSIILLRHNAVLACVRWRHVSCCCYNPPRVRVSVSAALRGESF